ncbi:MAG: hypothetical protein QOF44_2963 [Streptomyces sp.]|nr:hypothetical protein [Streptomyces sp.]
MSRDEIRIVVDALGGLLALLREADPADTKPRSTDSSGCA